MSNQVFGGRVLRRFHANRTQSASARVAPAAAALMLALAMTAGAAGPAWAATEKERELESRIERLETAVKSLVDELKKSRLETKKAIESVAKVAPKVTRSGKSGVTLTISGQVNRGVLIVDDGGDTEIFHVDNDHSSTRIRLEGRGRFDENIAVGANIEVEIESNSTGTVNMLGTKTTAVRGFTERKLEVFGEHKKIGRLTLGQGSTASDGSTEVDISGTTVILYSSQADLAGGQIFRFSSAPNVNSPNSTLTAANPTIDGSFSHMDGLSRRDRVRYDSPSIYGFTASASAISVGAYDGAIRYSGKHGPIKLAAAAAAAHDPAGATDRNQYSGSASALHTPTGLSATVAGGCRDAFGSDNLSCLDNRFWYAKGGWQWDIFAFGRTAFAVDYYSGRGIGQRGERSSAIGGGIVQRIDKVATEIYLGVRNYSLARSGGPAAGDFEDIFAVLTGARIKF